MGQYADMMLTGGSQPAAENPPQPPARSYSQDLLGGGTTARGQSTPAAVDPNAEPDADTWLGRRGQDIRGKQDPRFKDVSTVYEQFPEELRSPTATAAMLGASDPQMGDIVQKSLGDRFVRRERDANDYELFVTRGADGQEQRGYLNKPGLDTQDLWRTLYGITPYLAVGGAVGAATKAWPLVARAGAQGIGAGGTSIAGDVAQIPMGSEQLIEGTKAAIATGAGVGGSLLGDAASAVYQKFFAVPGLFDKTTGRLTEKGAAAAREAGLDVADVQGEIAKTFAQTYAKTGSASQAAVKAQEAEFGIPSTVGQRTKDPQLLTQEESMRRGIYGEKAKGVINAHDERQRAAVDYAARTAVPNTFKAESIRAGGSMDPRASLTGSASPPAQAVELGDSIRSGLRSAKDAAKSKEASAWEGATDILPKPEAFDLLPDALAGQLGGMRVTPQMEKAAGMARAIDDYVKGKAFAEPVADVLRQSPVKTIDEMRRQLLGMYKGAKDPTDASAARALYDGFNDWIEQAASKELLLGRPEAAANLRTARDVTKTIQSIFSPAVKGRKTPAAKIIADVMENADTPERIIDTIFRRDPTSTLRDGSVDALRSMKRALDDYADPRVASDTWADMKIAYWQRLVQNKRGDVFSAGQMLGNIKAALNNQTTLVRTLYSKTEIAQMQRLAGALDRIVYKPPNASGSGYTAASLAKEFFGKLFEAFGSKSIIARTALERSGLVDSYGAAAARGAVDQGVKAPANAMAPHAANAMAVGYQRYRQ